MRGQVMASARACTSVAAALHGTCDVDRWTSHIEQHNWLADAYQRVSAIYIAAVAGAIADG